MEDEHIALGTGIELDPALAATIQPGAAGAGAGRPGGVAAQFRLVGVVKGAAGDDAATAILERLATGEQMRIRIGDSLAPRVTVIAVEADAVWIRGPAGDERIGRVPSAGGAAGTVAAGRASPDDGKTLRGPARFGGTQLSDHRWRFSRDAIMAYYHELLEQPERLVKVFDSLAPVYNESREIEGYRVDIEGEADFFEAVGLRQGDVVRAVNSIPMTNRRRAENLIRRFAQNDLDTVVIELERDGRPVKHIYETN
jgi:type II secretory pathway component PulC